MNLRSVDGRGIRFSAQDPADGDRSIDTVNGGDDIDGDPLDSTAGALNYGRLTLGRLDARDVIVSSHDNPDDLFYEELGFFEGDPSKTAQIVTNLRDVMGLFKADVRSASGMNYNGTMANEKLDMGAGVTTLRGAMLTIDIAESATKLLDKIRADLGSVQGQMISTINNISVTQVNVKAAESQIREVDFAAESAEFSKLNILTQSGSYALSQANAVQQNILRLLN